MSLPFGLTPTQGVLAASAGFAALYQLQVRSQPSVPRCIVKTASTGLLSALAALRGAPTLLSSALALGATGDAFLAFDGDNAFLSGLTSFLTAHVLYIKLLSDTHPAGSVAAQLGLLGAGGWRTYAAGAVALSVSGMIAQLMPKVKKELRAPVVVYSLTIAAMSLLALTAENAKVTVGALLFTASDAILSADKFLVHPQSRWRGLMQHAVWVLYYSGQLLITLGFGRDE